MTVERPDHTGWAVPLKDEGTAAIVGLLADGSVAAQINVKASPAGRLVVWKKDQSEEALPWMPFEYSGSVDSATKNMSRYASFVLVNNALEGDPVSKSKLQEFPDYCQ